MGINRLTHPKGWMFVRSEDMTDDIGTRGLADLDVVSKDSVWIYGFYWMKRDKASFPAKTTDDIKLKNEDILALEDKHLLKYSSEMAEGLMANNFDKSYLISDVYETIAVDSCQRKIPTEVLQCYKFSKYVVDPNKARFKKVVNVFVFGLRFIKRVQKK